MAGGQRPPVRHEFIIREQDRQAIVLALAKLSLTRPGWLDMLRTIAADTLHGGIMFDEFRTLGFEQRPAAPVTVVNVGDPKPVPLPGAGEAGFLAAPFSPAEEPEHDPGCDFRTSRGVSFCSCGLGGAAADPFSFDNVCECGAGVDRLSTWHAEPPGWTCRECGGFVPRAHVTGESGPHKEKPWQEPKNYDPGAGGPVVPEETPPLPKLGDTEVSVGAGEQMPCCFGTDGIHKSSCRIVQGMAKGPGGAQLPVEDMPL